MKSYALLFLSLAVAVGCTEKEPVATREAAAPPPAEIESDAFVRHMHLHAKQLSQLNAHLANGDLEAAGTPGYWLSRHEGKNVFPDNLMPHLETMRLAARDVEQADTLEAARFAAKQIAASCRGCHTAAGVDVSSLELD